MRAELKEPLGQLLTGEPSQTALRLREILNEKKPPKFAVVGDFTTRNILTAGLEPDIVVVDHRIMRVNVEPMDLDSRQLFRTKNPAGEIEAEIWPVFKKAVTLNRRAAVIVEGEEDLLVLPLISMMPLGSVIVYGQPGSGLVVVEVSKERKGWAEEFMARMEEC